MALTSAEKQAAYRARQKAYASLAAHDAITGYVHKSSWSAPDEKPVVSPLSAKERKCLSRARQKALVVEKLPGLLGRIKPVAEVLPVEPQPVHASLPVFESVICDWLTITHPLREYYPPVNDGLILRLNKDGSRDWTTECWETLKCPSSDTSLRIKCDGLSIKMTGNIGRYGNPDNLLGYTVLECIEKWRAVLVDLFRPRTVTSTDDETGVTSIVRHPAPDFSHFFGDDVEMVNRHTGEFVRTGTRITRCDLAANFWTDNFSSLCSTLMTHRIGQHSPRSGKYGPTWGYDSKRSNWFKAKIYDKTCELEGRRTPAAGATTARFEVQLGSEMLKRRGLHILEKWKDADMGNVIYAEFSNQVFRDQATAESWNDLPEHLQKYALRWRDGVDLRLQCKSERTFYRVRKQLLDHGLDCSQPCNIMTLVRRIEVVKVQPLVTRRAA